MGRYHVGLSEYELEKKRVHSRMYDGLGGNRSSRNRKMAAIDAVLGQALDKEAGGRNRVISPEEFTASVESLVEGGLITESDAEHLHKVSEKYLNN